MCRSSCLSKWFLTLLSLHRHSLPLRGVEGCPHRGLLPMQELTQVPLGEARGPAHFEAGPQIFRVPSFPNFRVSHIQNFPGPRKSKIFGSHKSQIFRVPSIPNLPGPMQPEFSGPQKVQNFRVPEILNFPGSINPKFSGSHTSRIFRASEILNCALSSLQCLFNCLFCSLFGLVGWLVGCGRTVKKSVVI